MILGFGALKSVIENNLPFSDLYEHGLDENYFEGKEKQAYLFIKQFKYNHSIYPKTSTVEVETGQYKIFEKAPSEPLEYWASQLRTRKKFNLLNELKFHITQDLQAKDSDAAFQKVRKYNELIAGTEIGVSLADLKDQQLKVIEQHNKIQQEPGISGVPFGFEALDELTYGNQKGDFNLIVGVSGVCKSYFALRCALSACSEGANVIFISPEMPMVQSARRLLAMQANLKDRDIRKGRLSYYAVQKALDVINKPINIEEKGNYFKLLPSGIYSDINSITSICSEYKPDILIVDGIYLLKNKAKKFGSSWQEDESIYFALKNFCLHTDIPVLSTTQYSRGKDGKLEGTRGTQTAYQIASNFFSFEFENQEDRETNKPIQYRLLKTKKSRDGDSITIKFKLNFNKTTIEQHSIVGSNFEEQDPRFEDPDFMEEI